MVDAHSELMTQYPWGFGGTAPNASDNAPDTRAFDGDTLVFRDTGSSRSRRATTPTRRSSAPTASPSSGKTGPGHYGPFGAGRECAADQTPAPMPRSATTARSATARAGTCATA